MKKLAYFFRTFIFYLLLFAFYRLLFLFLFTFQNSQATSFERLFSFLYSFPLDLAVTGYIHIVPFLFLILQVFPIAGAFFNKVSKIYHGFIIVLINIESIANLAIYKYWHTLLNWRAIEYLSDPTGVVASVTASQLVFGLLVIALLCFVSIKIFFRIFYSEKIYERQLWHRQILLVAVSAGILFYLIRGGLGVVPINESKVYYSSNRLLNDATVNSMWHLVNSVATASKNANPFVSMTPDEARSQVEKIFNTAQNPSHQILRTTRPNIVLIMMESFSADLLGCMGAEVSATPFLDSLFRKGLLFTNIYSSGFRTDQGLASVLSGFPATPLYTIVRFQEKAAKLPSIAKALKQNNYSTTFYYGGESNFRNIKGYCYNTGFDRVVDKQDFNSDLPQSEWGVHDEYALLKQARDLNVEQQPFFSVLLTLSNHEPYLVPETGSSFKNNDESDQMRNSAFYTDQSLKKYFQFCSQQAWFNNTLFVLVADHGHYLPAKRNHATPEAHHIPLLLFGEVIRDEWRGTLNTHTGNHHDIPSTLLTQLSLKTDEFTWSKNLLDSSDTSFAYYQLEDGFGWIENNNWLYYSVTEKRKAEGNATAQNESGMIRRGSAFLQLLYQQFTEY